MTDPNKRARAEALESLRQRHLDDYEKVYSSIMGIIDKDEAEDKDKNNAHKNWMTLMGVAKASPEKSPEAPKQPPTPAQQVAPLRQELLDAIDAKIGAK